MADNDSAVLRDQIQLLNADTEQLSAMLSSIAGGLDALRAAVAGIVVFAQANDELRRSIETEFGQLRDNMRGATNTDYLGALNDEIARLTFYMVLARTEDAANALH